MPSGITITSCEPLLQPVFRFAPSPNGYLHLGHAYSALLNQKLARESGGRLLLRIEDIDTIRCTEALVAATVEDLDWLGIAWEQPVLRQSAEFARYRAAVAGLEQRGLVYPCACSRQEIARAVAAEETRRGAPWPRDPDGALLYPGTCRGGVPGAGPVAMRLDMSRAQALLGAELSWDEAGEGRVAADPAAWGDVVLARKETPTSYHLAVVMDDALQGVSDVVRGRDLFAATAIHRVLQEVLGLPQPRYHHHALLTDADGQKLAKSRLSTPLRALRAKGVTAGEVRRQLGFRPA